MYVFLKLSETFLICCLSLFKVVGYGSSSQVVINAKIYKH